MLALLAACSGGPAGVIRPAVPGFRARWLIDVIGPDQVRAVDKPSFDPATSSSLDPTEPVLSLEIGQQARAYPLAILERHRVVNDTFAGHPIAVTYAPLVNTGVVLDRVLANGKVLTFGVSGKLYLSDDVLFDRETTSLWTQFDGRSVAGQLRGITLTNFPSNVVAFGDFKASFANGEVLRAPGPADYSFSSDPQYDSRRAPIHDLFLAPVDARLPAMQRVAGVSIAGSARAYAYDALGASDEPSVVADRVGNTDIVVFFGGRARSPLDADRIADGRIVGGSGVFAPIAAGRHLTFVARAGAIVDRETNSTWTLLGRASSGRLVGSQLPEIQHLDAFWFAWSRFFPATDIWKGPPAAAG